MNWRLITTLDSREFELLVFWEGCCKGRFVLDGWMLALVIWAAGFGAGIVLARLWWKKQ